MLANWFLEEHTMVPTSGAIRQGRECNRIPVTDCYRLNVGHSSLILQFLSPREHNLVVTIIASDEKEVRLLRLAVLAEEVLRSGRLVVVNWLNGDIVARRNSLHALLLACVVDMVGAVTGMTDGVIGVTGVVIAEQNRAVTLLNAAALNTLEVVLKDWLD